MDPLKEISEAEQRDLTMETSTAPTRGSTARNGIFSYGGSLLQRRRFHIKPGKPPTESACLQGVISIILLTGENARLHSEAGVPTTGWFLLK